MKPVIRGSRRRRVRGSPRCRRRRAGCRTRPPSRRPSRDAAERVGDRRRGVPHQQRALQHQRELLDDASGAELDVVEGRRSPCATRATASSSRASAPRGELDLVEEGLHRLGLAGHGAQRVEGGDVARPLPDRRQRRLAVQPRHARSPRRSRCHPGTRAPQPRARARACRPSTSMTASATRRNIASPLVAAGGPVGGAGQAHPDGDGGLGLHGQVGQHVAHQRLVDQSARRRRSVTRVVDGAADAGAHPGRRADGAVEPGHVHHLDDRAHSAALVADQPAERAVVLDLAEALDRLPSLSLSRWSRIGLRVPSGSTRGTRKHDSPPGAWARVRKKSDIGAEVNHLWPTSAYAAVGRRRRRGGVGAHVRAALLLGHRHAGDQPALGPRRPQPGVVRRRGRAAARRLRREVGGVPAAPARRRRSSRSGTGGPARPRPTRRSSRPGRRARPGGRRPTARRAGRARRRRSSARATRGGTRPRRCDGRSGRGCAAPVGSSSASRPHSWASAAPAAYAESRAPRRSPSRRPRAPGSRAVRGYVATSWPTSGGTWLTTSWVDGIGAPSGRRRSAEYYILRSRDTRV